MTIKRLTNEELDEIKKRGEVATVHAEEWEIIDGGFVCRECVEGELTND